jgi:hypothetical protein
MVFSNSSTKLGIVEDIDFICGTNSTTYPIAEKTRNINVGMDTVADLIQKASGEWNWDDTNQTDLPIGKTDIVSGQTNYTVSSEFLSILGVYILDDSGEYVEIKPVDRNVILTLDTDDTGIAYGYYLSGNTIYLNRVPTANYTSGLKVHFQRNVSYFTAADTTKLAGFNPQFHKLLSLYASRDYAIAKGKNNLVVILNQIEKMENELKKSYARRNRTGNTNFNGGYLDISNYQ